MIQRRNLKNLETNENGDKATVEMPLSLPN